MVNDMECDPPNGKSWLHPCIRNTYLIIIFNNSMAEVNRIYMTIVSVPKYRSFVVSTVHKETSWYLQPVV